MKHTAVVYLQKRLKPVFPGETEYTVSDLPFDSDNYLTVAKQEVTFELPEESHTRELELQALEKRRHELHDEYLTKIQKLEQERATLATTSLI